MTDIGFYHLTRSSLVAALAPLLGRTLAAQERALVLCGNEEQVATIDDALWVSQNPDWLPHGTKATPYPSKQPIYVTETEINPAQAQFLFLTYGASTPNLAAYKRVFDLFDGTDLDAVAAARLRWKQAKAAGHGIAYWKQGDVGWEKSA